MKRSRDSQLGHNSIALPYGAGMAKRSYTLPRSKPNLAGLTARWPWALKCAPPPLNHHFQLGCHWFEPARFVNPNEGIQSARGRRGYGCRGRPLGNYSPGRASTRQRSGQTCLILLMSESATLVKPFFVPPLHGVQIADTLQATGAEGKPLLGSKLSADSGAKTRLGFGEN